MKIAVYAIAKNEEQFVKRWAHSCRDADFRLILDTGSTDETMREALNCGVSVSKEVFNPWRFDVARNKALSFIPDDIDICIALDMDEVLQEGWRESLEAISEETTRPRYKYVWSWNEDGTEGLVYGGDKIHARHNYLWKHPVHEVLYSQIDEVQSWCNLEIHHHPDTSKSRGQYFPLLELAVEEDPNNDRNRFYLGREYYFYNIYDKAIEQLNIYLTLAKWKPERAAAYRLLYKMTKNEEYLWKAISEDVNRRESWVLLAQHFYEKQDWESSRYASKMALRITQKPLDYLCESDSWTWLPHDLCAIASYNLGIYEEALVHGKIALEHKPNDQRLIKNTDFYTFATQA